MYVLVVSYLQILQYIYYLVLFLVIRYQKGWSIYLDDFVTPSY